MTEQIQQILISALEVIVTGVIGYLGILIGNYFRKKNKNDKVGKFESDITTIVFNAVTCIFQSFVDTLKKNDKFDEQAQLEAKEKAYQIISTQLTKELKDYIQENYGDIKEYIFNKIESTIYQLKN